MLRNVNKDNRDFSTFNFCYVFFSETVNLFLISNFNRNVFLLFLCFQKLTLFRRKIDLKVMESDYEFARNLHKELNGYEVAPFPPQCDLAGSIALSDEDEPISKRVKLRARSRSPLNNNLPEVSLANQQAITVRHFECRLFLQIIDNISDSKRKKVRTRLLYASNEHLHRFKLQSRMEGHCKF